MGCNEAREVLNNMHGFTESQKQIDDQTFWLLSKHFMACTDCKFLIKNELCQKVKEKHDKGKLDEGIYMLHGMLHEGLNLGDCVAHP